MEKERKRRVRKNEKHICNEIYWTACRAADYLGVSKCTVYIYAKNGLSFLKMGRNIYFKEDWLNQFINEKTKFQAYSHPKEAR
jgi:excisionase family DNA binding protein